MRQQAPRLTADRLGAFELALAVAGDDPAIAVATTHGRPRWILTRRVGARGPRRALLWRPNSRTGAGVARLLEATAALGRLGEPAPGRPRPGLAAHLGRLLDVPGLRLAGVAIPPRDRRRVHASFEAGGRIVCVAKVSVGAAHAAKERTVLDLLAASRDVHLFTPTPITLTSWNELTVLVLEPFHAHGLARRRFGAHEVAALGRIAELAPALAAVTGTCDGLVPVHGDFVAANSGRTAAGYTVWDWETTRLGGPLDDFFHWHVQALTPRSRNGIEELVDLARAPRGPLEELRLRLGLGRGECAHGLAQLGV